MITQDTGRPARARRLFTSAGLAGLLVAVGGVGMFSEIGKVGSEGLLAHIASTPVLPGFYAALFLGLGRGAHGFPSHVDLAPYLISFLFWWLIIDRGWAWWRGRTPRT